jgi:hypothetical protein
MEGKFAQARQAYVRAGECGGQMEGLREYIEAIDVRVAGGVQRVAGEGDDRSTPANSAGATLGENKSMVANNAAMAPGAEDADNNEDLATAALAGKMPVARGGERGPQASRPNGDGRENHASAR